jgi:hypothetical protein
MSRRLGNGLVVYGSIPDFAYLRLQIVARESGKQDERNQRSQSFEPIFFGGNMNKLVTYNRTLVSRSPPARKKKSEHDHGRPEASTARLNRTTPPAKSWTE